jgi:hypothetical protein
MDETERFNFDQTADLCIEQFSSFELSETAKKFSLNLDEPIACFAISAFMTTKAMHNRGRKTLVKETRKTLSEIQSTAIKLAELINSLPKHDVRVWFDVGDEVESLQNDRNPAVLQCIVFANTAKFVSEKILQPIPDGNYTLFLDQFLRWYLSALAKYPVKSKEELVLYIESSFIRDRSEIKKNFQKIMKIVESKDEKVSGQNFENNINKIYPRLKSEYASHPLIKT